MKKNTKIIIGATTAGVVVSAATLTVLLVLFLKKKGTGEPKYDVGTKGTVNMFFTNATLPLPTAAKATTQVASIIVKIASIQMVSKSGRTETLFPASGSTSSLISTSTASKQVDLMNVGQLSSLFLGTMQADTYKQIIIKSAPVASGTTDSNVYVVLSDGTQHPVTLPSGSTSGFKILIKEDVDLKPSSNVSIAININPVKSLVVTGNGKYILKPVVKAQVIPANTSS